MSFEDIPFVFIFLGYILAMILIFSWEPMRNLFLGLVLLSLGIFFGIGLLPTIAIGALLAAVVLLAQDWRLSIVFLLISIGLFALIGVLGL
jgi:hypothetical protein